MVHLQRHSAAYEIGFLLGSGGMASVRYGRRVHADGTSHAVAIKELHPHLAANPTFVGMFFDEARLASRVVHPNVVSVVDMVADSGRVWAVMPYFEGESLASLAERQAARARPVPTRVAVAITLDVLAGLAAAHAAIDERGQPLALVHRDVSPQNVLVGADGVARVLDFGVAKACGRIQETRDGQVKGKLAYMAPEQLAGDATPGTDVYAVAILLWEMLAGRRLFKADTDLELMGVVLAGAKQPPSAHADVPPAIDAVVARALSLDVRARFATAADMAGALTAASAGAVASRAEIAAWVHELAADVLTERREQAAKMVSASVSDLVVPTPAAIPIQRTLVMPRPQRSPRGRARLVMSALVALGAVFTVGAVGAASALGGREHVEVRSSVQAGPRSVAAPAPSEEARAADVRIEAVPPLEVASEPEPVATPVATKRSPYARAAAPPNKTRAARAVRSEAECQPVKPAAPAVDESCDPPFVVDAAGVRTYKRSCI